MIDRRSFATDLGFRTTGIAALAAADAGWRSLRRAALDAHGFHHAPPLVAVGLALAVFLAASLGIAALALGRHLFDRIEVASRWRRLSSDRRD